jgi:hypothetical protein
MTVPVGSRLCGRGPHPLTHPTLRAWSNHAGKAQKSLPALPTKNREKDSTGKPSCLPLVGPEVLKQLEKRAVGKEKK